MCITFNHGHMCVKQTRRKKCLVLKSNSCNIRNVLKEDPLSPARIFDKRFKVGSFFRPYTLHYITYHAIVFRFLVLILVYFVWLGRIFSIHYMVLKCIRAVVYLWRGSGVFQRIFLRLQIYNHVYNIVIC